MEVELKRLQQSGIIEPIEHSDWVAPIVPVVKKDGSVRICGDYRLTQQNLTPTHSPGLMTFLLHCLVVKHSVN